MRNKKLKLKKLILSYVDPSAWRNKAQIEKLDEKGWFERRRKILERDNYTCQYCGYRAEKFQIVHHIDGNPKNNKENNLMTICQMCNLIEHSGQGCVVNGIVDLYRESNYNQNDIIIITRELRDQGYHDEKIINKLGLKRKVSFKMDKKYLAKLFGFVTDRASKESNDMYDRWKIFHINNIRSERGKNQLTL